MPSREFMVGVEIPDFRRAPALEALPIDSLWVGGHIAAPTAVPEAMVGLAQLAAVTTRVRIGTAVLLLPLYAPAIVAKQVAEIDRLAAGRVALGVGVGGEYPDEFGACQVPVTERGERANEAIPLLRRLWTAETVDHDGTFYPMRHVRIHPAPAQAGGPPIIVAGRRAAAMQRAALMGDGWMPYLYSPRRYAESVHTIRGVASEAGRDLSTFTWYAFVFVHVDPDGDRARDAAAQFLGSTYRQDFGQMLGRVAVAGRPDEVRTPLKAFLDAGAEHFVFAPMAGGSDHDTVVRRLVYDVLLPLREEMTGA